MEEQIHASVASSLANFTTSSDESPYLDSVVLHSPLPTPAETLRAWTVLSGYHPRQIRHLGISNAPFAAVKALSASLAPSATASSGEGADGKPAPLSVVQNRFIPQTGFEAPLRAFLRDGVGGSTGVSVHSPGSVAFQSFWTLTGNPALLSSSVVGAVAAGAGVGREVALYALVLGLGNTVILDGTKNHMREDLEGVEKVGAWAEGEGRAAWEEALRGFKETVGERS